ncbi:MAG TPA: MBL fold metallo-hydrolase [Prolixibacteraceae bacterium]|nr:MBL fold metallo-hydrolase [Prolixibacteraceae bacterium]
MIEICALASGSNGNCYYIGNEHDAVLVDAGISAKRILMRMNDAGLDPSKVRGIFISHEHADHVSGVRVLVKRLGVKAWFSLGTFDALRESERPETYGIFKPGKAFHLGSFTIHPFLKNHDAAEPCSFRIEHDDWHVGVFTDIGEACDTVRHHLRKCHALFLETNYDEKMLWEGSYPYILKRRVASAHGHLSNDQAFKLIREHAGPELLHVFLSHLSGENNRPELAASRFESLADRFNVSLTSRNTFSGFCRLR